MDKMQYYKKRIQSETPKYKAWEKEHWETLKVLFRDYCKEMQVKYGTAAFYDFCTYLYGETKHGQ